MKLKASKIKITLAAMLLIGQFSYAAVSTEEAAKLKSTLMPLGGEKAGNKEGTIPAWTGGNSSAVPPTGKPSSLKDPFPNDKPLFSITAKNLEQHADKLSEGSLAMLKKYPDTYRIDVYPTRRTAAAPSWVYDNTFKNATKAKVNGDVLADAYGGIPFPIPKSGAEAIWNANVYWRGEATEINFEGWQLTSDGRRVLNTASTATVQMPYYFKEGSLDNFNGVFWTVRVANSGPPIRAGEGIVGHLNWDSEKDQTWVYLTGQRRTRKLPNACCDTPSPVSAGLMTFDEANVFSGSLSRYDWKIVEKKEMFIPYNTNKLYLPKTSDVLMDKHLNPDHVRWELHRVWVIEGNVKSGKRHTSPRSRYYLDEDTWIAALSDRWDAKGQLTRTVWAPIISAPEIPATTSMTSFGFYDLITGGWYAAVLFNDKGSYKILPRVSESNFTPEAMSGQGVR